MDFQAQTDTSISQINVTPLVDVMLVLLVIFMVTAPIIQQGVQVALPELTAVPLTGDDDQLVVVINRDGEVHLNNTLLTMIELEQRLTAIRDLRPDRTVYLRADKNVRYGTVVDVMAAVRQSGIFKLGMVTEPLQTE